MRLNRHISDHHDLIVVYINNDLLEWVHLDVDRHDDRFELNGDPERDERPVPRRRVERAERAAALWRGAE